VSRKTIDLIWRVAARDHSVRPRREGGGPQVEDQVIALVVERPADTDPEPHALADDGGLGDQALRVRRQH
jgi:hypothetical protein